MNEINRQYEMIELVANSLGPDLLKTVVFVGGCTTGLLVTDELTKEEIRHTDDVDLIIHLASYTKWNRLQENLRQKGFKDDTSEDAPLCRMTLHSLKVDFMPDNDDILGFSNIWYEKALTTSIDFDLNDHLQIRLVSPVYFVATKLEAFKGRGQGDILASHDLEDIVNLVEGRDELIEEIFHADEDVKKYIVEQFRILNEETDFEYLIQSATRGNQEREDLIYSKIDRIAGFL